MQFLHRFLPGPKGSSGGRSGKKTHMNDMNDIMNMWIADCVKIYGCFASVIRSRLFLTVGFVSCGAGRGPWADPTSSSSL